MCVQFPAWAELEIEPVASSGSDNQLFRLGTDMAIRIAKASWSSSLIRREHMILPRIHGLLPLDVPRLLAIGEPGEGVEGYWSITSWIEAAPADRSAFDTVRSAERLADFLHALHRIPSDAALPAGEANHFRGARLDMQSPRVEAAVAALSDELNPVQMRALWRQALNAPMHAASPQWLHGDLHAGNLLLRDGVLAAVIDWGLAGIGDPAIDLAPAWCVFTGVARRTFVDAMQSDEAAWMRARGWLLSVSLVALAYYRDKSEAISAGARQAIKEVIANENGP
jgi:aminoglycoside phosphotransferase (APT) family kinase protein